jgi:hypothetical protein
MELWEGVDPDELSAEQKLEKEAEAEAAATGGKVEAKEEFVLTMDDMDDIMEQGDTMDGLEVRRLCDDSVEKGTQAHTDTFLYFRAMGQPCKWISMMMTILGGTTATFTGISSSRRRHRRVQCGPGGTRACVTAARTRI